MRVKPTADDATLDFICSYITVCQITIWHLVSGRVLFRNLKHHQHKTRADNKTTDYWTSQTQERSLTKPHYCIWYNAHEQGKQNLVFEREVSSSKHFILLIYFESSEWTAGVIQHALCRLVSQDWQHTILEHFMHNLSQRNQRCPNQGLWFGHAVSEEEGKKQAIEADLHF